MHAGPIGQRRAGDDQRAEQLRPQRGEDHHRPAGLAVADHAGLAVGIGMPLDHLFDEDRFGARNALDGLARHGFGQEADEIAGMARLHGDADLAVGLEAADAGAVTGARIDHDERPALQVDLHALGRDDAHQRVVDRLFQLAAVDDQFGGVAQDMRRRLGDMLAVLVAALAHDVEEQHAALPGIDHVFHGFGDEPRHGAARQLRLSRDITSILPPSGN